MKNDEDAPNRPHEFSGPPDGYVRRETIFKTLGAAIGVLGAGIGLVRFFDAYRDYIDRRVDNERVERIMADKELQRQILEYVSRRR